MKSFTYFLDYDDFDDSSEERKIDIELPQGYALGEVDPEGNTAELKMLHIYPEYQGQGYSKIILQQFIDYVKRETSASKITLEAQAVHNGRLSTDQLIQYYRQYGFEITQGNYMVLKLYKWTFL